MARYGQIRLLAAAMISLQIIETLRVRGRVGRNGTLQQKS